MIRDYEIKGNKGEETLYLYFEFGTEFAKLKSKDKKRQLSQIISDYIKEKNIKFDGKKIAIISGGLLVATLALKSPNVNYSSHNMATDPYAYASSVVLMEGDDDLPEFCEEVKTSTGIEVKKEEITSTDKQPITKKESSTVNKGVTNKNNVSTGQTNKNNAAGSTATSKVETPKVDVPKKEETPQEVTPVDNNIYVTVKRTNGQVLRIELEEYVVGVVGAEMPASFNLEALKAQAVIARTYALRALDRGTVLTDNSSTQNYKSDDQLRAMWGSGYQTYYNKVKNAVVSTKGMYLTYNGSIIEAVYHSTSNGRTEDSRFVWGNAFPYLVSVDSPYDSSNKSFLQTVSFSYEQLSSKLGVPITSETNLEIVSRTDGLRVLELNVGGIPFTGVVVRNKLGLRSADFDITPTEGGYIFTTRGYGHGVGLSQYGANGMANAGSTFDAILKHYYRGVTLSVK